MSHPALARFLDDAHWLQHATSTALITQEDVSWTYAQLHRAIVQVAAGLQDQGLRHGERVVLIMDDTPAFYAAFLGAMWMGAVPIPTNFLSRPDHIGFFVDDAYAVAVVVDAALLPRFQGELDARPNTRMIVANGSAPDGAGSLDQWLMALPRSVERAPAHPDDPALWLYSSGSTGKPKGVVHRHASISVTVEQYAVGVLGMSASDVVYSTTPLFHAYGLGNSLTFPLSVGATVVLSNGRPTPDKILDRVRRHRPTLYFSVPALYAALLATDETSAVDWSSVRHGASAAEALPAEVARRFQALTGVEILDGIGSTEMLHIYCSNRAQRPVWGTSGSAVDGYELQIRDEHGQPAPVGEGGELFVRGGSALVQYWHQVDRSRRKLVGEWFATGDRYRTDEAGNYVYEGRMDDMMKIGGLWVSPTDIESRLIEHEAVSEAAVVGVMSDQRSRIAAHVILAPGHAPGDALADALREFCKEGLQRYQFPHFVHFVSDFPRTATGKIQRFKLRDG